VKEERELVYEEFGELVDEFVDSDMEGSIRNPPRPMKTAKAPVLPQRSDKRASRTLENVNVELKSLDPSIKAKEADKKVEIMDPHELYLSSEEEGSLSDDYSDVEFLVDFSPVDEGEAFSAPSSRGSSRKSQEDTARLISFTSVGKPQLVHISIDRYSQKRQSLAFDAEVKPLSLPKARKPAPLKLSPFRRLSISSTMSFSNAPQGLRPLPNESSPNLTALPPRKSSIASNFSNLVTSTKHAFLSSDPFPANAANEIMMPAELEANPTPPTPKTPIGMAAAAWKTGLSRTMSIARKQPSIPKMNRTYTASESTRRGLGIRVDPKVANQLDEQDPWKQRHRAATTPQTLHDGPVRYADIMRNASRNTNRNANKGPPPAPLSPKKERALSLGMRGLSRRKSIRGKDRYLG
jgi:hypothetical protein